MDQVIRKIVRLRKKKGIEAALAAERTVNIAVKKEADSQGVPPMGTKGEKGGDWLPESSGRENERGVKDAYLERNIPEKGATALCERRKGKEVEGRRCLRYPNADLYGGRKDEVHFRKPRKGYGRGVSRR